MGWGSGSPWRQDAQLRAAQPTKEKQVGRMNSWLGAWKEQKAKPERDCGSGREDNEIQKEGKPLGGMGESGRDSAGGQAGTAMVSGWTAAEPGPCRGCPRAEGQLVMEARMENQPREDPPGHGH